PRPPPSPPAGEPQRATPSSTSCWPASVETESVWSVMQDNRQRVAAADFCPDERSRSKQIQIGCCAHAAVACGKGPKLEQLAATIWCLAATGKVHLTLTAHNDAVLNSGGTGEIKMADDADVIVIGAGLA